MQHRALPRQVGFAISGKMEGFFGWLRAIYRKYVSYRKCLSYNCAVNSHPRGLVNHVTDNNQASGEVAGVEPAVYP